MKMCIDSDEMTIYLTRIYLQEKLDFDLEEYFKKLFLKLKNFYDINVSGYYLIDVFENKNYGYIIKINKEHFDYLEYLDNQVDMRINVHEDTDILFEMKDIEIAQFQKILDFYFYHNKLYGKLKKEINTITLSQLLEMCDSVYCDENNMIENYGKKLKID